jgi:hypothetical protein
VRAVWTKFRQSPIRGAIVANLIWSIKNPDSIFTRHRSTAKLFVLYSQPHSNHLLYRKKTCSLYLRVLTSVLNTRKLLNSVGAPQRMLVFGHNGTSNCPDAVWTLARRQGKTSAFEARWHEKTRSRILPTDLGRALAQSALLAPPALLHVAPAQDPLPDPPIRCCHQRVDSPACLSGSHPTCTW